MMKTVLNGLPISHTLMRTKFKAYTRFAEVYDLMGGDRFSEQMVEYTFSLLKKFRYQPRTILDLCCGTGTAAIMFTEQGYDVTGLDGSEYMLTAARYKAKKKKLKIPFYHQKLPDFKIRQKKSKEPLKFDLITCFYDSLNYLLEEDQLAAAFRNVNRHLTEDGLFIFDMNTFRALKYIWGAKTYADSLDDIAWIWKTITYDRARLTDLRAIFFLEKGNRWERFEELHTERAYSNSTIRKCLRHSGFEIPGFYDCFKNRKPTAKTTRIAVAAKKTKTV